MKVTIYSKEGCQYCDHAKTLCESEGLDYEKLMVDKEELKKAGAIVPGYRPGEHTATYLDYILTRLTVVGAMYLSAICALPIVLMDSYAVPLYLGGTSLLIVVSVAIDTVTQIQSHLIAHQYQGLTGRTRPKKGKRR